MIKNSVKKVKIQLSGYILRPINIKSSLSSVDPNEENLCLH